MKILSLMEGGSFAGRYKTLLMQGIITRQSTDPDSKWHDTNEKLTKRQGKGDTRLLKRAIFFQNQCFLSGNIHLSKVVGSGSINILWIGDWSWENYGVWLEFWRGFFPGLQCYCSLHHRPWLEKKTTEPKVAGHRKSKRACWERYFKMGMAKISREPPALAASGLLICSMHSIRGKLTTRKQGVGINRQFSQ